MAMLTKLVKKLKTTPTLVRLPITLHTLLHPSPIPSSSVSHHPTKSYSSAPAILPPNASNPQFFQPHHFPLKFSPAQTHYEVTTFNFKANEPNTEINIDGVVEILRKTKSLSSETEAMDSLVASGVQLSGGLVCSVIWELREEWELALLAFRWSLKINSSNSTAWDLMVWVLGQQRRFATAWSLVRDMLHSSMDARRAVLIMIESYAVANRPHKAIQTFEAMEKFRISQDSGALYSLLHALCKNGNIEEAEEFMMLNKSLFPLETESFNIILNGWCNIYLDLIEAKRVWREMSKCCITPDATSYTHMISCSSKVGNLFDSLRLYDEMKKRGWVPGLDVYNSLIYVLTKDNCLTEALNLVDKIKEAGLQPDSTTYNSMILPLCEAHKLDEARSLMNNMVNLGIDPTTETYHAFLVVEIADRMVELLKQMKEVGCGPYHSTFLLILNRLLNLRQPEEALRMWVEMINYEVAPDSTHYSVMVRGMIACGWLAKARRFYDDMKLRGFSDDPMIVKLFQEPVTGDKEHGKHQGSHREEDTRNTCKKRRKGRRKLRKSI